MAGGEEGLEHKTRKQIYNYISTYPGVSFGVIRRFLGVNESTLKYHLHYLERNNKVISKHEGRQRCYYCSHHKALKDVSTTVLHRGNLSETQNKILRIIKNMPGITNKKLMNFTKLNRKTLSYNINKLLEHNLIWKTRNSRTIGYEHITKDKLRGEIYHQLLMKLLADEIDEDTFLRIKRKLDSIDIDEIEI